MGSNGMLKRVRKDFDLYLFILPAVIGIFIFRYIPMYGVQIAFRDFMPTRGIWGSPWVGLAQFTRFFESPDFWKIISNTLGLSLFQLVAGFPVPIVIALSLNQMRNASIKRGVQTLIYAPHFISTVVLVGMIFAFTSPSTGVINYIVSLFGGEPALFMADPKYFRPIYVLSGIWQDAGWGTIIYIAALSNVNTDLYEAAKIDGANKWQIIRNVDIPVIMPTVVILLVLATGGLMSIGFEKAYLMQKDLNLDASEIIATYVYKKGLRRAEYSYSSAIGLFNSAINFILLVLVNTFTKKANKDISLF